MESDSKILKSAKSLILLTLFVKIVGIIKQSVIAYTFGISYQMDVYTIASDFISEVGVVFFSALSINLVSIYIETKNKNKGDEDTLFSNTIIIFTFFSAIVSIILCIFADPVSKLLEPGLEGEYLKKLSWYIRFFSIALVSIGIGNICIAVLNAEEHFLPGKFIGIIQSICIISSCLILAKFVGTTALMIGFLSYYIIQNVFLLYFVSKYIKFKIYKCFKDKRVRKLIRLCVPLFISNSVIQLNAMIDKAIASQLGEGSVSALSYGSFIFNSIHSIIIGNLCTILFTHFVTYVTQNDTESLAKSFRKAVILLTFLLAPIMAFCIGEAEFIVKILYARGEFDASSVALTTYALSGYSFGILFIALRDLMMQVLYAYQKIRAAMLNGIMGVVINVSLSLLLSEYFGIFGIALADGIAYFIVAVIGYIEVNKYQSNLINRKTILEISKTLFALILCLFLIYFCKGIFSSVTILLQGIIMFIILLIFYMIISIIFKNDALYIIRRTIFGDKK